MNRQSLLRVSSDDLDKANAGPVELDVKPPTDADGKKLDLTQKPKTNTLIVLYNDQSTMIEQSEKVDFSGLKEGIKQLTDSVMKAFPTAATGPEGMLASLAANPTGQNC